MVDGPHRGAGHAGGAEAAVRRRRRSTSCSSGSRVRQARGGAAVSALARPAAEGGAPHPARPADADRAARCCRSCRSCCSATRIRTDVDDVRLAVVDPAPDCADAGAAQPLRRRRRRSASWPSLRAPRDLEPLFQTGEAQQALVFEPGFADDLARGEPAQLLIVTDATEPNTGSADPGLRAGGHRRRIERELRRRRAGAARVRDRRRAGAHALQPDARELEPVRARA